MPGDSSAQFVGALTSLDWTEISRTNPRCDRVLASCKGWDAVGTRRERSEIAPQLRPAPLGRNWGYFAPQSPELFHSRSNVLIRSKSPSFRSGRPTAAGWCEPR